MPPASPELIALRGSATAVADYLRYAIYSILFLRGVYAIEDFMIVSRFDLELLIATNEELETFVSSVLTQAEQWLVSDSIKQVVLVIVSKETKLTLERWVFNVQVTPEGSNRTDEEMAREAHLMLAGIRGTNSMLREIAEPTLCNILLHLKDGESSSELPEGWEDAPTTHPIEQDYASEVKLKHASTVKHRVLASVVYQD